MNVLAIGAHPDDLEIECFGTLARYVQRGDYVCCASVASGSLGHMTIPPEELARIRLGEAERAAAVIGAEYKAIGCGDMAVNYYDEDTRRKIADLMRYARPDVIITHHPDDYMNDHIETSRLVFYAAFAATLPHYAGAIQAASVDVVPIYYMETSGGLGFVPEAYVDITGTFELKKRALECHESQLVWLKDHDDSNPLDGIRIAAEYRGMQSGVRYAEGFCRCRTDGRVTCGRLLP